MAQITLPEAQDTVFELPEGLVRTESDLTPEELGYVLDFCIKYDTRDILQWGSGLSTAILSQWAGVTVVEDDDERAKKLPEKSKVYNYARIKTDYSFSGSGTTQKFPLYIINGMPEQTAAEFERLQRAMSDAYEMSDVVFVADAFGINTLRAQMKDLAPFYNIVAIIPSKDGRYLTHWERNLLTKRKSVL